jgi:hypothetical protein
VLWTPPHQLEEHKPPRRTKRERVQPTGTLTSQAHHTRCCGWNDGCGRREEIDTHCSVQRNRQRPRQLQVLSLVVTNRYVCGAVDENVGGHEDWVGEQPQPGRILPTCSLLHLMARVMPSCEGLNERWECVRVRVRVRVCVCVCVCVVCVRACACVCVRVEVMCEAMRPWSWCQATARRRRVIEGDTRLPLCHCFELPCGCHATEKPRELSVLQNT